VALIYRGSRDGWGVETFKARVWGQGANIILVKTKQGAIIGGFTTKSWGPDPGPYTVDAAAFIFNMNQRFNQTNG
jgi:hypothetical protein